MIERIRQVLPGWIKDDALFTRPSTYSVSLITTGVLALFLLLPTPGWLSPIPLILVWIEAFLAVFATILVVGSIGVICMIPEETAIKVKSLNSIKTTFENRVVGIVLDLIVIVLSLALGFGIPVTIMIVCMVLLLISRTVYKKRLKELVMFKLSYNPDAENEV